MCGICGCSGQEGEVVIRRPGHHHNEEYLQDPQHRGQGTPSQNVNDSHSHGHNHAHHHGHEHHRHSHDHPHDHHHGDMREIQLEKDILSHNNLLAERNRGFLEAKNITTLNIISSPGAGKTTLLEKTITDLKKDIRFFVIEGDQQSMNDAERIDATGVPVLQVNTGSGCHLDASMVNRALKKLDLDDHSMLFIENVGNLVCPALFDLGEARRIVMISVTEGDDKPLKYPNVFQHADICIINKTDLLPYVQFGVEKARDLAQKINPHMHFFEMSATTGDGLEAWYEWLKSTMSNGGS